ncbi:UNVERIFIED_CONTAM: hypothetical protein K2H54_020371 [Gekko kuhli]
MELGSEKREEPPTRFPETPPTHPRSTAQGEKPPKRDTTAREEQDDSGGDEGKWHSHCSVPHPRPQDDNSAGDASGTPEMTASGSARLKMLKGDAVAEGMSASGAMASGHGWQQLPPRGSL